MQPRVGCLLLLLLAACADVTATDVLRVAVWPIPVPDLSGPPRERDAEWDEEEAPAPPPEPTLGLALGSRRAVATLVQAMGERRIWRSLGGVAVETSGARVVATAGLSQTVAATRFEGPDPLEDPRALAGREARSRRTVDLMGPRGNPARMRFGVILECRLSGLAAEQPEVLLVEERCRAGRDDLVNRFWVDERTGAVFRSEQWIGDDLPSLTVEPRS